MDFFFLFSVRQTSSLINISVAVVNNCFLSRFKIQPDKIHNMKLILLKLKIRYILLYAKQILKMNDKDPSKSV